MLMAVSRTCLHQCGRDADIGYFEMVRYTKSCPIVQAKQLDLYRTWTLIAFLLITQSSVYLLDKRLIKALHKHAQSLGHSEEDSKRWFGTLWGANTQAAN